MSIYVPPVHKVPKDKDDSHYLKSFSKDQVEEYIQFFNEFGFVVVRDVLNQKECDDTIDDIWNYLEQKKWNHFLTKLDNAVQISRNDPTTWKNQTWPEMMEEGILGSPPVFTAQALKNRQNPEVYKVFANLLGRKDLLVNHDRYGLFRPTKNVKINGKKYSQEQWKTFRNLHIDMNPWMHVEDTVATQSETILAKLRYKRGSDFIAENNEVGVLLDNQLHLQGLINLADNYEDDGGFHIIPGFKQHFVEWTTRNDHLKKKYGKQMTFIVLPGTDKLHQQSVRVTARAGSLVVWDQRTIHGSAPNDSDRARYAQFLKFFPATPMNPERADARKEGIVERLDEIKFEENGLTDLGKQLFGLQSWA
jgi:hypothetical protein